MSVPAACILFLALQLISILTLMAASQLTGGL
jgi:hypothetical protein